MATALVTGATVGIGESFARLLASKGFDLVIVARDQERLQQRAESLRSQYKIQVEVLRADLNVESDLSHVRERLLSTESPIEVLINNAGFGIKDSFLTSSLDDELRLIRVLAEVPMQLMHTVLPAMVARNSGTIINVSSVASFIAGGSYSAAKSWLTVMSEALHTELSQTQVKVSALCPGFTHTEFHQRGRMKMERLPVFMWLNSDRVVADAWKVSQAGGVISVPGGQYKALTFLARYLPRPIVRKLGINVRKRQR
jgi:short-subunit dehydrogenase